MIYIQKTVNNKIVTDNFLEYIPNSIAVYLDDRLIDSYSNDSLNSRYLVIEIPLVDLSNLENKEYTLKLMDDTTLIKTELVVVHTSATIETNTVNNIKTELFYE